MGIACSQEPQVESIGPSETATPTTSAASLASRSSVVFSGGYETDPQDHGRPVILISGALGVPPQVFRDAFSGVTPARNGPPTREHAQANKRILMDALGKYGVTNDRLDDVSNFYRYRPYDDELWKHSPAKAEAIIADGKVTGFEVIDPGYGYSSPPDVAVPGFPGLTVNISLKYGADLKQNGGVTEIELSQAD